MALTKDTKIILFIFCMFIFFSPGFIISLPAGKGCPTFFGLKKKGCGSSYAAVFVHALLFSIAFKLAYDKYFLPKTKVDVAEEIKEAVRRRRRRRRRRR